MAAAPVLASSGFAADLDQLCAAQGLVPPNPAEIARTNDPPDGDCALCHSFDSSLGESPDAANVTPAGDDWNAGVLDVFCGPANLPPEIFTITDVTVLVDELILFYVNTSDPEGRTVNLAAANLPAGSRFDVDGNGNGSFFWIPAYDQGGTWIVTIIATDTGSPPASSSVDVTITVNGGNRPPQLDPVGDQTATVGMPLQFDISGMDPDSDPLVFDVNPMLAGATLLPNGTPASMTFAWTPDAGAVGNHPVTFEVSDGALFDDEMIMITVGDVNTPPMLSEIGDRQVDVGAPLLIALEASDADDDGLSFSSAGLPADAMLVDRGDGTGEIQWTPTEAGLLMVTVTVTDDGTPPESASETFTIEALDPPVDSNLELVRARYHKRTGNLKVIGQGAGPGAVVEIFDANTGVLVGTTSANAGGLFWVRLQPAVVPCAVEARSEGGSSDPRDVRRAPANCSEAPAANIKRALWKCAYGGLYVSGDGAPGRVYLRIYDEGGELLATTKTSRMGSFRVYTRLSESPAAVRAAVVIGEEEWMMLDAVEVQSIGWGCESDPWPAPGGDGGSDGEGPGCRDDSDSDSDRSFSRKARRLWKKIKRYYSW